MKGWTTFVVANCAAWLDAGQPIGAVFPVEPDAHDARHGDRWPARYAGAEAYYVALPGGQLWCPWQKAYSKDRGYHGNGWNVSGPPERLTCAPSIATNAYHGFLRDGVLTPDLEGRRYPEPSS